jgi:hypothetical protein
VLAKSESESQLCMLVLSPYGWSGASFLCVSIHINTFVNIHINFFSIFQKFLKNKLVPKFGENWWASLRYFAIGCAQ